MNCRCCLAAGGAQGFTQQGDGNPRPRCTALGAKGLCKKTEEYFYWCKHYGNQF